MPNLATLADRVWYAIHCLPRDADKEPPSWRSIEVENGIALATISKIIHGTATRHQHLTIVRLAKALHVTAEWLVDGGDDDAPTPTGVVPPRVPEKADGKPDWGRTGDLPGWDAAVAEARGTKPELPKGAYRAGAEMPLIRRVTQATPNIAYAMALFAWDTSTLAERRKFSTLEVQAERPSSKMRASRLTSKTRK